MSHGINALMHPVEAPELGSALHCSVFQPKVAELLNGDDAVLPSPKLTN